jgi:hypothetical protein
MEGVAVRQRVFVQVLACWVLSVADLEAEEDMHSLDYPDLLSDGDESIVFPHWEQAVRLIQEHLGQSHLPFWGFALYCFAPDCSRLAAPSNAAMLLPSPLPQSPVEGRDS